MKTRQMILCALFAALTAAGIFVKIPIPGTPMSFTLQTFFIFLAGLLLDVITSYSIHYTKLYDLCYSQPHV